MLRLKFNIWYLFLKARTLFTLNTTYKYIFLIIIFLYRFTASAQDISSFKSINTTHGLPSNYVFAVTEDNDGYLWAATDKGLCRYNGAVWEVYDTDNGFPGNYISSMFNDKRNGLWLFITEAGNQWWHFNTITKKLTEVALPFNINGGSTFTDNNGNLLFYTWYEMNKENNTQDRKVYIVYPENPTTYKYILQSSGNLFYITNIKDKNIQVITATNAPYTKTTFHSPEGFTIQNTYLPDSLQITNYPKSYSDGIVFNYTMKTYFFDSSNRYLFTRQGVLRTPTMYSICSTHEGSFFAYPTGYFTLYKKNGDIVHYTLPKGNNDFYISDIYVSKNGKVLLSTMGNGINLLEPASKIHIGAQIRNIEKNNNNIYFHSEINLYSISKANIVKELTLGNNTLCMYIDKDTLITGGLHDIRWYKQKNGNYRLSHIARFTGGISSVFFSNGFWASTYDVGLIPLSQTHQELFDSKNHLANYPLKIIEKTINLKNGIASLSYEKGMVLHRSNSINDYTVITQKNGLMSNAVYNVYERNDTLWICTKYGINIWHNNKVIQQLSYNEGFKGINAVYAFHDVAGKFWVLGDKYLHLLQNNRLYALGSVHITDNSSDAIITGMYEFASNTMYVGTNHSLYILPLNNVIPDTIVHFPRIKYVTINNQKTAYKNEKIQLTYNYDLLEFHFLPPVSSFAPKGTIYYWLNDEISEMKPVSDSFTVKFIKLRPGSYKLYVKYINEDGYESKSVLALSFTIMPPFWQQLWFILLCSFVVIAIVAIIIFTAQKRKYLKKLLELKVQQKIQKEKERISRDLHDNVGGQLSFVLFSIDGIHEKEKQKQELITKNVNESIRTVINNLRETIWAINDEQINVKDLYDKLKVYTRNMFKHSDTVISFQENFNTDKMLDSLTGLNLFRICQEIINNSFKHAAANNLIVFIACSKEKILITIQDDGKGFDCNNLSKKGYGLQNMQSRANEYKIKICCTSNINEGTSYEIQLAP